MTSNRGKNPKSLQNIRKANPKGMLTSKGLRLTADEDTVLFWESLSTVERGELVKKARLYSLDKSTRID